MGECAILLWLSVVAVTDADTRRIPNVLVWPGLCGAVGASVAHPGAALAAVVAATPYALAFGVGWCGGGDVKLAAACGALALRWDAALVVVALASFVAVGTVLADRAAPRERSVTGSHPHGPALVAATFVVAGLL
ncbi:A24 family peptidase [Gordonia sp. NPDC058843]|uniref:A24 family peptidase n=1 Tax=Gordonia sp. NPDC058843 TaxID=3346648 RepID=UPI0036CCB6D2